MAPFATHARGIPFLLGRVERTQRLAPSPEAVEQHRKPGHEWDADDDGDDGGEEREEKKGPAGSGEKRDDENCHERQNHRR